MSQDPSLFTRGRIYANLARYYFKEQRDGSDVGQVDETYLDWVLEQYADEDTVFVHAGLSDVKQAFNTDPYKLLLKKLTDNFETVLAPGFTPSFRTSGIYHKEYSKPGYGMFSRLFFEDAEYRTDDAIHSILGHGRNPFEGCNHRDSFANDSCWALLKDQNTLYLNVGTPWIISTQLHYVERQCDVPYLTPTPYSGVVYYDQERHEEIEQVNPSHDLVIKWNRKRVYRRLKRDGVLQDHSKANLTLFAFKAGELCQSLEQKVSANPYYLIT